MVTDDNGGNNTGNPDDTCTPKIYGWVYPSTNGNGRDRDCPVNYNLFAGSPFTDEFYGMACDIALHLFDGNNRVEYCQP